MKEQIKKIIGPEKWAAISLLFNGQAGEPPVDQEKPEEMQAKQGVLKDGTQVEWMGDLAAGTAMVVLTTEGPQPAPDGTHEFVTGEMVTTENGTITEVKQVEANPDVPEVAMTAEQVTAAIQTAMTAQEAMFNARIKTLETANLNLSKQNKELFGVIEKMVEAEEAPAPGTDPFGKAGQEKHDRFKVMAENMANIKKNKNN